MGMAGCCLDIKGGLSWKTFFIGEMPTPTSYINTYIFLK